VPFPSAPLSTYGRVFPFFFQAPFFSYGTTPPPISRRLTVARNPCILNLKSGSSLESDRPHIPFEEEMVSPFFRSDPKDEPLLQEFLDPGRFPLSPLT